tara:strand:+ start:145305 stop:145802 length:498 start_codon:yes stop_codon:yes gene_type:complete
MLLMLSFISFISGIGLSYAQMFTVQAREWGDLIGLTLAMSALYEEIRLSKPVFARFPTQLTFLPLIVILFYPLIVDSTVVKELLFQTYEGGMLIVALLLFSNNHKFYSKSYLLIGGLLLLTVSYIMKWFFYDLNAAQVLTGVLFSAGLVITTIGLTHNNIKTSNS